MSQIWCAIVELDAMAHEFDGTNKNKGGKAKTGDNKEQFLLL